MAWDTRDEGPAGQIVSQVLVTRTLTDDGGDVITVQSEPEGMTVLEIVGLLAFASNTALTGQDHGDED